MVRVTNPKTLKSVSVPTSFDEYTKEVCEQLTAKYEIPEHYSIVVLAINTNPMFISNNTKIDSSTTKTFLGKINYGDNQKPYINVEVGDYVRMRIADIDLAYKLDHPCGADLDKFTNFINDFPKTNYSKELKDLTEILTNKVTLFKLMVVPNHVLLAATKPNCIYLHPFA